MDSERAGKPIAAVGRFALALAIAWTAVVAASLAWNLRETRVATESVAQTQARTAYEKDVVYRRWNAQHGGVYVRMADGVEPNPYLKVPERDIVLPSGEQFTLVNPAQMTRQVFELMREDSGLRGHITSLNPLRPENAADAWETQALNAFNQGAVEVSSMERLDGEPYMRLMRPLVTEASCLPCHAAQGYKVGDIRGGISVAVPMAPLWATMGAQDQGLWFGHGGLWIIGLCGIFAGSSVAQRQTRERRVAEEALGVRTTALDKVANAILITDRQGNIVYVNPAFTTLTGYAADEVLGKTPRILKSGRHDAWFYKNLWDLVLGGGVWRGEITNRRKDGTLYVEEMTITPVRGRTGVIEHFIAVKEDITERKASDHGFRAHCERLALPLQIAQIAQRAGNVATLLDQTLDILLTLQECGTEAKAVVFLVDEKAKGLRLVKTRGHFGAEFLESEAFVPLGRCLCGRAAQSGEVLVCENCFDDPRHENRWMGMGVHGHYSIPLKSKGRVLGVITVYTVVRPQTDPQRVDLLRQVGEVVGAAVERLRAREPKRTEL